MDQPICRRKGHTLTVWSVRLVGYSWRLTRIGSQRTRLHIFCRRFAYGRRAPTTQQLIGQEAYWKNSHRRLAPMTKGTQSNQTAPGNGALALPFHGERRRRAVPEQHRWPMYVHAHL